MRNGIHRAISLQFPREPMVRHFWRQSHKANDELQTLPFLGVTGGAGNPLIPLTGQRL